MTRPSGSRWWGLAAATELQQPFATTFMGKVLIGVDLCLCPDIKGNLARHLGRKVEYRTWFGHHMRFRVP